MAKYTKLETIKSPSMDIYYSAGSYEKEHVKKQNISILNNIKTKFGKYIDKWGKILEIDSYVIAGFIAVESGGKENIGRNSSDATGLCQVTRVNIREVIPKFKSVTKHDIPEEIKTYLKTKAPFLLASNFMSTQQLSSDNMSKLNQLLQYDEEFNILMGAMALRWLMEFLKLNNEASLAKVILGYNQSAYGRVQKYKKMVVTTEELYRDTKAGGTKAPKETRDYIAKLMGKFGFIQLLIDNNIYSSSII